MALIAGTLAVGLAGGAFAQDGDATSTTYDKGGLNFTTGKSFSLSMSTNMQIRAELTDDNDPAGGTVAGDSMSFYVRRLKTSLKGHVFDKKWSYGMTYAWHDTTGLALEDAHVKYAAGDDWTVGAGRRKSFFNLQEYTSSSAQQFVDRSAANEAFNNDFMTGVWVDGNMKLGESGHTFRYHFGVFNGTDRGPGSNTGLQRDFASGSGGATANRDFNMLYATRLEIIGNGDGKSDVTKGESDLRSDEKERPLQFILGYGLSLNRLGPGEAPNLGGVVGGHGADVWNMAVDARVHMDGISLNAGIFHRTFNYDDTADADVGHAGGYTDIGAYAQLGYAIHMEGGILEPAIRYGLVDRDDDNGGGRQFDQNELALGLNYFLHGHRVKLSFDATYAESRAHGVTPVPPAFNATEPSVTYRLQLQLGF
jgi:hypothetical protein